jgi:glyoxylase-like metal-dependent hydrolase (beta-lactamase superfamily II)
VTAAGTGPGGVRIERVVTSGEFAIDGQTWPVQNNVWLIGDEREVLVIDAAHDAAAIRKAIGGRRVTAIVCTHAHNDHVNAAPELAELSGDAPILLHPLDAPLWALTHPDRTPDERLADKLWLEVAGVRLSTLHTPGHTQGAVSLYAPDLATVFTGDTLFHGGPGATGRSFSDFPAIIDSIRDRLLTLPPETVVRTGHGEETTVGEEAPGLQAWIARGH